jgi:hypothetical protein
MLPPKTKLHPVRTQKSTRENTFEKQRTLTSVIDAGRTKSKQKRYFCAVAEPGNALALAPPQASLP